MEVERGSVSQNATSEPKPSSKGPDDLAYSMNRWLQQHPNEEPRRPQGPERV